MLTSHTHSSEAALAVSAMVKKGAVMTFPTSAKVLPATVNNDLYSHPHNISLLKIRLNNPSMIASTREETKGINMQSCLYHNRLLSTNLSKPILSSPLTT